MQSNTSTGNLVRAAAAGDTSAFSELVGRYGDRVRALASARIGAHIRARIDPDDVVQETFAKALRALPEFEWRGEASFVRWLRTIAENVVLRTADRQRTERHFQIGEKCVRSEDEPATASRHLRRDERFDRLQDAMASLSDDHREVIMLARIEGLQLKEVATRMRRSVSAVQNLLLRALKELKNSFGDTESLNLPDRRLGKRSDVD